MSLGRSAPGSLTSSGFFFSARKESAKEKQLKEEEKILESVAEGRGTIIVGAERRWTEPPPSHFKQAVCPKASCLWGAGTSLSYVCLLSLDVSEGDGQRHHI